MQLLAQTFELLLERQHGVGITLRCTAHGVGYRHGLLLQRPTRVAQGDGDLTLILTGTLAEDQSCAFQAFQQGSQRGGIGNSRSPMSDTVISSCSQSTSITRYCG